MARQNSTDQSTALMEVMAWIVATGQMLILPRGLSRRQSARYVGVGTTVFDEMVADGRMPAPKRVNSLSIWDRLQLDEGIEALPCAKDTNPWDEEPSP